MPAITGETVSNTQKHRIRIAGDGTMRGTKITDAATGETISGVQRYTVTQDAFKAARAVIDVVAPSIDLECDAQVKHVGEDRSDPIEAEIQAKGLTAPRFTQADVEANICNEFYFTAEDGVVGSHRGLIQHGNQLHSISTLTFCVLVLRNGFTVTGESVHASPANFDAEIGRKAARKNAIAKIWPLMGYELKCRLAREAAEKEGGAA